jgi:hypothetical protein
MMSEPIEPGTNTIACGWARETFGLRGTGLHGRWGTIVTNPIEVPPV